MAPKWQVKKPVVEKSEQQLATAPVQPVKKPVVEKNEQQRPALVFARVGDSAEQAQLMAKAKLENAMLKLKYYQGRGLVLAKDPQFQTVTISTAGGAVVMGSVGGAFGLASGIVLGTVAGAVPALFTFGLSLPIGAAVGGGAGLCAGSAAGAGIGGIGGGAAGFGAYKYRVQIKNGLVTVQKTALVSHAQAKVAASCAVDKTKAKVVIIVDGVKQKSAIAGKFAQTTASELAALPKKAMASDKFKVTAATATAGAVAGGGAGAIVGTTAGAALGLIPALFTFGLSIPVGAVVGGFVGTGSGTAVGAAGGSALGYGGYTYQKEIRSGADLLVTTVKDHSASAKSKAYLSAAKVSESIKFYSGTGGTA